jgi:hypothetical protein
MSAGKTMQEDGGSPAYPGVDAAGARTESSTKR